MTVTLSLPAPSEPYLGAGLLPGDFYSYKELLSEAERQTIERIREFLRTQVSPIVPDWTDRDSEKSLSCRAI
jgi:glutaryl-CoA dehydrogenase